MTEITPPDQSDSAARLVYLDQLSALLWPGASRVRSRRPRHGEFLVAPAERLPRVLLPADNPRAAAHALRAQGVGSAGSAQLQRRALAGLARTGLLPWFMPGRLRPDSTTASIVDYLAGVFDRPVSVSAALTPPRANRKPVLHVQSDAGTSLGWAKIGIDALTSALVAGEAETLTFLAAARPPQLIVPQVLHNGEWNGLRVLVLSALPTARATRSDSRLRSSAMRSLAGTTTHDVPAGSYPMRLADRAASLTARAGAADQLALAELASQLTALAAAAVRTPLAEGAWHGDWTVWNCGQHDGALLVWDWERYAVGVPRGFDALHYRVQHELITARSTHSAAARRCIAEAPATLADWQVPPPAARLTAALYLLEIAVRYIADDQRGAHGYGGDVETWILPAVREFLHQFHEV